MGDALTEARLYYIDRLKVLGLILVILAHVDLPIWLAQIRSFDVPLLVFVSGYLARRSYKNGNICGYYRKRFFRLAVPAWIFAIIFWIIQSIVLTPPTFMDLLKGITFQRDTNLLGMLWVIWVYIVCALLIPFVNKLNLGAKTQWTLILLLLVFQLLCSHTNLSESRILYCSLFTVIPYGFITYLGFIYCDMKTKNKIALTVSCLFVFGVITTILWYKDGAVLPITDYKYPAQIYFLCYAIPIIGFLFETLPKFDKHKPSLFVQFISKSSLWIYLWHILVLYAVKLFIEDPMYWWLQYIIVLLVSVLITWIQNKAVNYLMSKFGLNFLTVFKG